MAIRQSAHNFTFTAPTSKTGRVSAQASRTVAVLRSASMEAIKGAAQGRGLGAKLALHAVVGDGTTLSALRALPVADWQGGYWQDALAVLMTAYPGNLPAEQIGQGRAAVFALLNNAESQANRRAGLAEPGSKARESALATVARVRADVVLFAAFAQHQEDATSAARDEITAQHRAGMISTDDAVAALQRTRISEQSARAMLEEAQGEPA